MAASESGLSSMFTTGVTLRLERGEARMSYTGSITFLSAMASDSGRIFPQFPRHAQPQPHRQGNTHTTRFYNLLHFSIPLT